MTQDVPQDDSLIVNGEVVTTRNDCEDQIKLMAKKLNVSHDDAWSHVKDQLISYLTRTSKAQTPTKAKPASAAPATENRQADETGNTSNPDDENALTFNGNELLEITDNILPENLRAQGLSVLDAISSGKIKLRGEHPNSELLRKTVVNTAGMAPEQIEQVTVESQKAIVELQSQSPQVQYPLFRPTVRVMPSDFNRTSLFHVGSNNLPRRFCKNEKLGQVGDGVTIYYQGEELRQTDEDVFRQLIHVARGSHPWEYIYLHQCQFIKDAKGTKRHLSSRDSEEIANILMRLRGGVLLIQSKRRGNFITCNLLIEYEGEGEQQRVRLDPRIVLLFDGYTAIDENILYSLKAIPAKIYSFIATIPHAGLYPISIKKLFELCYGRTEYQVREHKHRNPDKTTKEAETAISKKYSDFLCKNLPKALEELRKDRGVIVSYEINKKEEKVAIVKNPHLNAEVHLVNGDSEGDQPLLEVNPAA